MSPLRPLFTSKTPSRRHPATKLTVAGLLLSVASLFPVPGTAQTIPTYSNSDTLSFNGQKLINANLVDVNGDGLVDVAACFQNPSSGTNAGNGKAIYATEEFVIWQQTPQGRYPTAIDLGAVEHCEQVSVGPVFGDGYQSIVLPGGPVSQNGSGVPAYTVFRGTANGFTGPTYGSNADDSQQETNGNPAWPSGQSQLAIFLGPNNTVTAYEANVQKSLATYDFAGAGAVSSSTMKASTEGPGARGSYAVAQGPDLEGKGYPSMFLYDGNYMYVTQLQPNSDSFELPEDWNYSYQPGAMGATVAVAPNNIAPHLFPCVPVEVVPGTSFGCVWYKLATDGSNTFVLEYSSSNGTTALPNTYSFPTFTSNVGQATVPSTLFGVYPWNLNNGNNDIAVIEGDGKIFAGVHTGPGTYAAPVQMASVPTGSYIFDVAQGQTCGPQYFLASDANAGVKGTVTLTASPSASAYSENTFGTHINVYTAAAYSCPSAKIATTITGSTSTPTLQQSTSNIFKYSFAFTAPSSANTATGTLSYTLDGVAWGATNPVTSDGVNATGSSRASGFTVGTHTLTLNYSGDANYAASSASVTFTITAPPAAATISAAFNPTSITYGSVASYTGSISFPSGGAAPNGTLSYTLDGAAYGGSTPITANSNFGGSLRTLGVGTHTMTASWSGDSNYAAASVNYTVTVAAGSASFALNATPNPATTGQKVTITSTASTSSQTMAVPTGSVTFSDGGTSLGSAPLSAGVASLQTTFTTSGSHPITQCYSGDSNYASTCTSVPSSFPVTVNLPTTSTALGISPNPVVKGANATFTATVTASSGTPSGTVTFVADGSTTLGTASISNGTASIVNNSLSAGTHSIVASFSGSGFQPSSSNATSLTVNQPTPSVIVIANYSPSAYVGYQATLTVTVKGSYGTPTGTVTLTTPSGKIATVTLDSTGTGSTPVTWTTPGTQNVTGSYSGDTTYSAATGNLSLPVLQIPTAVTIQGTPNPMIGGQGSTLVVQLIAQPSVTQLSQLGSTAQAPAMTGSFAVADNASCTDGNPSGTNKYGPYTIGSDGRYLFNVTGAQACVGTHTLSLVYSGDANYVGSNTNGFAEKVVPAISSVVINVAAAGTPAASVRLRAMDVASSSSSVNVSAGENVTITANVLDPLGAAQTAGTVTFFANGAPLGTAAVNAGTATLTTNMLPAGTAAVTASYAGVYPGTSSSFPVAVAGFTASAPESSVSLVMGGSATASLVLQPDAGFSGTVALSCDGLPAPGTCSVVPTVDVNGQVTAKVTISATAQQAAVRPVSNGTVLAFGLPTLGLLGMLRRRKLAGIALLAFLGIVGMGGLTGCGMVNSNSNSTLTPGSYKVTVKATAGADVQTTVLDVTVNP